MYNLYFMELFEKEMQTILAHKEQYMKLQAAALEVKNELDDLRKEKAKIKDTNSKEYADLLEKIKDAKLRGENLIKAGEKEEKRFENIKKYILEELRKNKEILEKYKDVEDDKTINGFKLGVKELSINKEKLEDKLLDIDSKLELNNLSKEEISKLDGKSRKEALEAREQYLNNKKEYEKYEKLKYVTLLGDEIPKKRIFQTESAIAYVEKEFKIENIEEVISKLETILDIQKQRPKIKFDAKTHTYTYIDERGKTTEIDGLFEKDENGKYKSILSEENIKSTINVAKERGLTRRQIKAIDVNIIMVLGRMNPDLRNNYFESIKEGKEADFDIEYDIRQKGVDKENKINRKSLKSIKKSAMRQKFKGMATVIKDKSKAKWAGIFTALGLSTLAGGAIANKALNSGDNFAKAESVLDGDNIRLNNVIGDIDLTKQEDSKELVEEDSKEIVEENLESEIMLGDLVKVAEGSMLFNDPTDELRMMSGLNANEKVVIKGTSEDKMYKVTKIGYYAPTGENIEIEEGENLEEALKNKNMDKSFIENESTIKMCHVVAPGIAQWVSIDDTEKVEVDKFGNRVEKTEEEKEIEEAYENHTQQYSKTSQQQEER